MRQSTYQELDARYAIEMYVMGKEQCGELHVPPRLLNRSSVDTEDVDLVSTFGNAVRSAQKEGSASRRKTILWKEVQ